MKFRRKGGDMSVRIVDRFVDCGFRTGRNVLDPGTEVYGRALKIGLSTGVSGGSPSKPTAFRLCGLVL